MENANLDSNLENELGEWNVIKPKKHWEIEHKHTGIKVSLWIRGKREAGYEDKKPGWVVELKNAQGSVLHEMAGKRTYYAGKLEKSRSNAQISAVNILKNFLKDITVEPEIKTKQELWETSINLDYWLKDIMNEHANFSGLTEEEADDIRRFSYRTNTDYPIRKLYSDRLFKFTQSALFEARSDLWKISKEIKDLKQELETAKNHEEKRYQEWQGKSESKQVNYIREGKTRFWKKEHHSGGFGDKGVTVDVPFYVDDFREVPNRDYRAFQSDITMQELIKTVEIKQKELLEKVREICLDINRVTVITLYCETAMDSVMHSKQKHEQQILLQSIQSKISPEEFQALEATGLKP